MGWCNLYDLTIATHWYVELEGYVHSSTVLEITVQLPGYVYHFSIVSKSIPVIGAWCCFAEKNVTPVR